MLRIFFFALVLTFLNDVDAQTVNSGKIVYELTDKKEKQSLILTFNDSSSISVFHKAGMDTNYSSYSALNADSRSMMVKVSQYDSIGKIVYRNFNSKTIILRQTAIKPLSAFTVEDEWGAIPWKLHEDTQEILGYECKKATGYFRGRTYTAWFAPELKFSYGPWKLFGLPGIILSAKDDSNKFSFIATQISYPSDNPIVISPPLEKETKTLKEYVYYLDNMFQLSFDKLASEMPAGNGMSISSPVRTTTIDEERNNSLEKTFEWEEKSKKRKKDKGQFIETRE
jgi:GLPGLI family protein